MTITEYYIELYKRVGVDVDHLQRIGTTEEKRVENQNIIVEMGEIVANLEVVKKGITSSEYAEKIDAKLNEICSSSKVVSQMKELKSFRQST